MKSCGTLLMFWDYDTQWGGDRSRGPGGPKQWGMLDFVNTERLLELHSEYGIPACFAVVGAAALPGDRPYHDPAQIRRLQAAGHEIASHSLHHDWLPGLDSSALRTTLRSSKDVLEQCIGAEVASFVPPYNQPFDYPAGWSFSYSERRLAGPARTDLPRLCEALRDTGYTFCRVAYRPVFIRLAEIMLRRRMRWPNSLDTIRDVKVLRLDAGGFDTEALTALEQSAVDGGFVVVYGHPHSLHSGNAQDEVHLVPFLQRASTLVREKRLRVLLPRELEHGN